MAFGKLLLECTTQLWAGCGLNSRGSQPGRLTPSPSYLSTTPPATHCPPFSIPLATPMSFASSSGRVGIYFSRSIGAQESARCIQKFAIKTGSAAVSIATFYLILLVKVLTYPWQQLAIKSSANGCGSCERSPINQSRAGNAVEEELATNRYQKTIEHVAQGTEPEAMSSPAVIWIIKDML